MKTTYLFILGLVAILSLTGCHTTVVYRDPPPYREVIIVEPEHHGHWHRY